LRHEWKREGEHRSSVALQVFTLAYLCWICYSAGDMLALPQQFHVRQVALTMQSLTSIAIKKERFQDSTPM
jgi:hypothetical protein